MSLLIDTPRWHWRGRLWAHLISDESLDELHGAARELGLRWVLFGRDHYDVPEELWPAACEIAALVDSRVIVRSLRASGLRVGGGKAKKAWQWRPSLPDSFADPEVVDFLEQLESMLPAHERDIVERPDQALVMHLCRTIDVGGAVAERLVVPDAVQLVETAGAEFYSVEVVLEKQSARSTTPTRPDR